MNKDMLQVNRYWMNVFTSTIVLEFDKVLSEEVAYSLRLAITQSSGYENVVIVPNEQLPSLDGFIDGWDGVESAKSRILKAFHHVKQVFYE